jgi:hypothetical protein
MLSATVVVVLDFTVGGTNSLFLVEILAKTTPTVATIIASSKNAIFFI